MAVNHQRIKELLREEENRADTSLRSKSLQRARGQEVPTTLTPYEWQQWYAENGVPESHRQGQKTDAAPWYKRMFKALFKRSFATR